MPTRSKDGARPFELTPAELGLADPGVIHRRRIAALGLFTAIVLGIGLVAGETVLADDGRTGRALLLRWTLLPLSIALSLALFAGARRPATSLRRLERAGLAYYVLIAATIAILVNTPTWPTAFKLPSWSPVAVWVLVYPFMVPTRPRRMVAAATLAALMDPLALVAMHVAHDPGLPRPGLMAMRFFPNVVAVFLALLESRMLSGLEERLTKAREVGAYRLVEQLGRGGMGEVWLAEHHMLARPAAVKLIRPDALDDRDPKLAHVVLERFEREVQATGELRSPHTVQIYDYGIGRDGTFYYAMELLDGLDLHRVVLRHGPQSPARTVYLLRQACHSLHEAHLRGLIHRDVKPANIFACRYGADLDFVKVLDFGLVKRHVAAGSEEGTQLTLQGAAPGSPAFMAPEIATAEPNIDGRADIYALGCVAFWMLTGRIVFEASSSMRMMLAHANTAPERPSARAGREFPEALEDLIMRCLSKHPAERPQTAGELRELLGGLGLHQEWTEGKRAEWWATYGPPPRHEPLAARAVELFETEVG